MIGMWEKSLSKRYLLFKPSEGLADAMRRMGRFVAYAQNYNRVLVIHSDNANPRNGIGVPFDMVFRPVVEMPNVIWHFTEELRELFASLKQEDPNIIRGDADYDADVLIGVNCKYIKSAGDMSEVLQVQPSIATQISQRLLDLPTEYDAVHIRNTDIKTDYHKAFAEIESDLPILVCSDDFHCIKYARSLWGDQVLTINEITPGGPLHFRRGDKYESMIVLLSDLRGLAGAKSLHVFKAHQKTKRKDVMRLSGFSRLAVRLHKDRLFRARFFNE
jgi:hypothetical protein